MAIPEAAFYFFLGIYETVCYGTLSEIHNNHIKAAYRDPTLNRDPGPTLPQYQHLESWKKVLGADH